MRWCCILTLCASLPLIHFTITKQPLSVLLQFDARHRKLAQPAWSFAAAGICSV